MNYALEAVQCREEKFSELNYFDGVLHCMWARNAIENGGDQVEAMKHAIFYGWV